MRFLHPDGTRVHVAYCTNVHAAEDLDGVMSQLLTYALPLRERLGTNVLGLGLWLARDVAGRLEADPAAVAGLRKRLDDHGLEVVTLNGFPYQAFHAPVVKQTVYQPNWADRRRLEHTKRLVTILSTLLPADADRGSISTLPLAWRTDWNEESRTLAHRNLMLLRRELADHADRTGRPVEVGFEPEPGCVIETTADAVEHLAEQAGDFLGVSLDACHLAVSFEEPEAALTRLQDSGIPLVKLQASAALHAEDTSSSRTREALAAFAVSPFLHQVRERGRLEVKRADDLAQVLDGTSPLPGQDPWRVHFHIPVSAEPAPPLRGTQSALADTLAAVLGGPHPATTHIEVETYTWSVLPDGHRPEGTHELIDGLAAEMDWIRTQLTRLGLTEETTS
ncbi:metabolite traffic protein EboE [Streptomyces exfoliatus]|uniref:metabolite traffic protein EboE n=1 Tax=Streptomyces exfoliatus TaxID=1905 RepID=UPI003C2AD5D6